jgi:hypothetical protein
LQYIECNLKEFSLSTTKNVIKFKSFNQKGGLIFSAPGGRNKEKYNAAKIFAANARARLTAPRAEKMPSQNAWAALCAANEKAGQFSEGQILGCILKIVRTHFAACLPVRSQEAKEGGGEESPPQNFENAAEPHR